MIQGRVDRKEGATGRGEGLARAGSGEECWRREGWTGRRGRGGGYGNGEEVNGKLEMGAGGGGQSGRGRRMARLGGILQMDMMECLGGHRL